MGVVKDGFEEEIRLDDEFTPDSKARATIAWLQKWKRVAITAVIVVLLYNILCSNLLKGSSLETDFTVVFAERIEAGLMFFLITSVVGTFFGLFLGLLPMRNLPYFLKLPFATLSGILLVNLYMAARLTTTLVSAVLG